MKDKTMRTVGNRRIYKLKLQEKQLLHREGIDEWFGRILKIPIEPYDASETVQEQMRHLLRRILLLSRTLFQAIRVPIFDPGEILEMVADNTTAGHYTLTVSLPDIGFISSNVYETVLMTASKIVLSYANKPVTPENIQMLFEEMETKCIKPLTSLSGSGKSTVPVLREVHNADIPFNHLGGGVYQLGWGSKSRRMDRSMCESDSAIGTKMAQNKVHTAHLLRMAGLPAPEHSIVMTKEDALAAAKQLGWPVVVKPADMDRGEGVSVGIDRESLLFDAFDIAHKASRSKQVIIEREVEGVCCRIFVANDQVLYAVNRLPKSVVGDGKKKVSELIDEANALERNAPPWLKSEPFLSDALAIEAMGAAGFTLTSIPDAGRLVPLRKIESTQWGGVDEDVTESIHPENAEVALRCAKLFGLGIAGIDIITPDIRLPWYENGAIVNEVNFSPLFGGGDISRSKIPLFLKSFIQGDGRIPIIAIVGEGAMERARDIQEQENLKGLRCYCSSHDKSLTHTGKEIHFAFNSLYKRCQSLLIRFDVDALVLAIETDEFLRTGLPVDRLETIIIASPPSNHYEELIVLLKKINHISITK